MNIPKPFLLTVWILSYKFLPKKKPPSIYPDRYLREYRKNEEKIKIYLRMVFTTSGIWNLEHRESFNYSNKLFETYFQNIIII